MVGTSGGNGSDIDGVAVVVVEQEDVVISLAEGDRESACPVGENFACGSVPNVDTDRLGGLSGWLC